MSKAKGKYVFITSVALNDNHFMVDDICRNLYVFYGLS